jgi:hypothetical protein
MLLCNSNKVIKNINLPSCKKCIYYKPDIFNTDFTYKYNKCEQFGTKNIVTDKIEYDFADECRKDEQKCGINGTKFIKETNINGKILKHKIISKTLNYSPYVILSITFILYSYCVIYKLI